MNDNKSAITLITTAVAVLAIVCVGTICYLSFRAIKIPPELNTLAGTLAGNLIAMLVKTSPTGGTPSPSPTSIPVSSTVPTPVVVTNETSDPVPTTNQP